MDNLDDLKALWHIAKTDSLPSSNEMLHIVRKFRDQKLRSKWLVIVSSLLLSCLMIAVLFVVDFKLISTYVGGVLITISGLWLAVSNIRSLKRFAKLDDCSNLEFLNFIEQTRKNQIYYYKKTMIGLVSLCSAGLLFYLYEPAYQHPLWLIGIYLAILAYVAVMWFVVRPRAFKRHATELNATQERIENILKQPK
jgi:xanthine/uracil permease